MDCNRRQWLAALGAGALAASLGRAAPPGDKPTPLRITGMRVTPIALPDPPLLAASGCHGHGRQTVTRRTSVARVTLAPGTECTVTASLLVIVWRFSFWGADNYS